MGDLAYLGIADTAKAFRAGSLTPTIVLTQLLDRIARLDSRLHAFLRVDAQPALARAEQATREIASGRWRGPLHGVAIAVKDNIDVAGQATSCHSALMAGHVAARHAAVVRRLLDAGAIILGKTALHEFATGGPAFDLPWPPARNPWDAALHPGGSSSGSACAVAAGMVPAALGTDTGGSVRNPATCCGIIGLKPSYERIDRQGVFPLASTLDHVGLLTRSVEDAALLLDIVASPRHGSAVQEAEGKHFGIDLAHDIGLGIAGLRIGVIAHFYTHDDVADPQIVTAIDSALGVLRGLGATTAPLRLSSLQTWAECGRIIQQAEQYAVHDKWLRERPQEYCELSRRKLGAGASLAAADYEEALRMRQALRREFELAMVGFDVLVTASSMTLPCAIDDADAIARGYGRHARMPFNVTGAPALSLPVGFTADGLPLGMQMAARVDDERKLLRVAAAYEAVTPWRERRPLL